MTIVLTTHYLEEAEEMCDEIAIINHGAVVARDTTAALLGRLDAKTMVIRPDGAGPRCPGRGAGGRSARDGTLAITYQSGRTPGRGGAGGGARGRDPHSGQLSVFSASSA